MQAGLTGPRSRLWLLRLLQVSRLNILNNELAEDVKALVSLRPLRISAFSALKDYFNAEVTEIRRGPQRENPNLDRQL